VHRYSQLFFRLTAGILAIASAFSGINQAEATLLLGGVQQSSDLTAITPGLSREIARAAEQPSVNWFEIPRWMAGKWTKEGDVTINMTDLRSGTECSGNSWRANRMTRQFGHQIDKAGNMWWALLEPAEQEGEAQQGAVQFLVVGLKLERVTANEVITRTRYLVTECSGWGVCKQYQQEALNHYSLSNDGALRNRSYNRVFDLAGRPQREAVLISQWRKVGPFIPVQTFHGIDLRQSLNYYLRTHNLEQLATQSSFLNSP